jgi:tetratricopeptide (TPR) repeat protein
LLLLMGSWHRGEMRRLSPYILFALLVWFVHNLIDINVYFPSLGAIGAVMLGTLLRRPAAVHLPQPRALNIAVATLSLATLVFASLVMVSSELQVRAQQEFEVNNVSAAVKTIETAKAIMPFNSSLFHDSGDIRLNLYHRTHDLKDLDIATQSFQRAIALSPNKVGPHIGLSLCLSSANRVEDARAELRVAERLHPDSTYIQAIARLLEKRKTGIVN